MDCSVFHLLMAEMKAAELGELENVLGRSLFASVLASLSAASFPGTPLWPGHHLTVTFISGKLW